MVALECLSQGIDGEVDQKIERFLVDIRNVRRKTTRADQSIGEIRDVVWLQHRGQK